MRKNQFRPLMQANRDQRRFRRVPGTAKVTVFDGERRRRGWVADISGGGAYLKLDQELESFDAAPEPGRYVDVDIETLSYLGAQVVRAEDAGFAVLFDLDEKQSRELSRLIEAA